MISIITYVDLNSIKSTFYLYTSFKTIIYNRQLLVSYKFSEDRNVVRDHSILCLR